MSLEQNLSSSAESWLSGEVLLPDRSAALARLVHRRARGRRLAHGARIAGVAVAVAGLFFFWPVLISVASDSPVIGPIITRWTGMDSGARWAAEGGYVVAVGKSASDRGYTFRVESVFADAARTVINYVVEGPGLGESTPPPQIDFMLNYKPYNGVSRTEYEIVDGRMVGKATIRPLPHPVALVTMTLEEVTGVKGNWRVSFMASRSALDALTRSLDVGETWVREEPSSPPQPTEISQADPPADVQPPLKQMVTPPGEPNRLPERVEIERTWQNDGYSLTVNRLLLTPTETVVEMSGSVPQGFVVRAAELVADGKSVPFHEGESRWDGYFRFAFDRLDGEPTTVTFRLKEVIQWRDGGPVIDLRRPGVRTTYGQTWFEVDSVRVENGKSIVLLRIGCEGCSAGKAAEYFRSWTLIDPDGHSHAIVDGHGLQDEDPAAWLWELTAEGEITAPVRLESRRHAVPIPGLFEMTIPLN